VTRYPAIFVGDVLVATPKDFGFYGKGEGAGDGRYTPWKSAESHERFRTDLAKAIRVALEGKSGAVPRRTASKREAQGARRLPELGLTDLDGRPVTRASLAGRVVVVEFWATWCPPCRGTLRWLGELRRKHGDRLAVVAVAVESEEAAVRKLAGELGLPFTWAMGTPAVAREFGDISAVPTLFLFDARGRGAGTWYGAPPSLHQDVEAALSGLLASKPT